MGRASWLGVLLWCAGCATAYEEAMVAQRSQAESAGAEVRALAAPAPEDRRSAGFAQDAAAAPDEVAPSVERQVIYSASLHLVVVSPTEALKSVQAMATEAGGHLQESQSTAITVRVPAAKFEAALARIASLGEVLERSVQASDVTEQMFDLEIRLGNARKARERLLEHLSKSDKIEDTLKIEAELTRVTGEIEQLEGRQRFLASRIAMSTIRVDFAVRQPRQSGTRLGLPFAWVERLGDGLVAGSVERAPRKPDYFLFFFRLGPDFEVPSEFLRYYSSSSRVEALSADGVRLKVQVHDNHDEGALAFWSQLARRALVEGRGLAISAEEELGEGRALIVGAREVAGETFGYMAVLVRTDGEVHTFEAWGPRAAFERHRAALLESARSLEP